MPEFEKYRIKNIWFGLIFLKDLEPKSPLHVPLTYKMACALDNKAS